MKYHEFMLAENEAVTCITREGDITIRILSINDANDEIYIWIDGCVNSVSLGLGPDKEIWGTPACKGLPRLWLLFSYILTYEVRRNAFMPTYNEFVEDYLFARKKYRKPWNKRWLAVAFTYRTLVMMGACLRIQFGGIAAPLLNWIAKIFFPQNH